MNGLRGCKRTSLSPPGGLRHQQEDACSGDALRGHPVSLLAAALVPEPAVLFSSAFTLFHASGKTTLLWTVCFFYVLAFVSAQGRMFPDSFLCCWLALGHLRPLTKLEYYSCKNQMPFNISSDKKKISQFSSSWNGGLLWPSCCICKITNNVGLWMGTSQGAPPPPKAEWQLLEAFSSCLVKTELTIPKFVIDSLISTISI